MSMILLKEFFSVLLLFAIVAIETNFRAFAVGVFFEGVFIETVLFFSLSIYSLIE